MTEIQMTETRKRLAVYQRYLSLFDALEHSNFGFVSDFGIRVLNLFSEAQVRTGRTFKDCTSKTDGLGVIISKRMCPLR